MGLPVQDGRDQGKGGVSIARKRKDVIGLRCRLRVQQRVAIMEYAVAHDILPASWPFGLNRRTIRECCAPTGAATARRSAIVRRARRHRTPPDMEGPAVKRFVTAPSISRWMLPSEHGRGERG